MTYVLKVSYYDQESDYEEYGELDELIESYQGCIEQIADLGQAFGDVCRIVAMRRTANKTTVLQSRDYA